MPEDVLEKLSSVIGRKIEPVATKLPTQKTQTPSLDQVIGRQVQPAKTSPSFTSRYTIYTNARKNGFDQEGAAKAAMAAGGSISAAPPETAWQKAKSAFGRTEVGRTVENNLDEFGRMFHSAAEKANNPMGGTDEEWKDFQKKQQEFFEKHLGKNIVSGVATGAAEFGEEFASPVQIALMVGTFGESALVRAAAKLGIPYAVPAARTLSKLMQLQFSAQMVEGAATGVENTYKAASNGDWEGVGQSAIEGLASGLMAKGLISHEQAQSRVRGDLETHARQMYGVPEGSPLKGAVTSRFNQLNPFQQGAVIDAAVKASPEYTEILNQANTQDAAAREKTKKQRERKLNDYYSTAVEQAWDQNAARRTMRGLEKGRKAIYGMAVEDARKDQLRIIAQTIREAAEKRSKALNDEYEKARQEGISERPERAKERAGARSARQQYADTLSTRRNEAYAQRQTSREAQATTEVPQRNVDSVIDDDGNVSYPAMFFGEESSFGVSPDTAGNAVYRRTPRGYEWLDSNGNFTDTPENTYFSHDPQTADTIARLSSLSATANELADSDGATEGQKNEANELAEIRRKLVSGKIDAREAQKQAGIAEKVTLSDEYTAAQQGQLNGPYHESTRADYVAMLEEEARKSGMADEEVDDLISNAGALAREQTENNLNHVFQPGDYLVSKRGITWTLDSKGMLHPDNGGQPVPLMKNGLYSNDALQMASSGRVGYGQQTREQRRLNAARQREIEKAIEEKQTEVEREMRLSTQREGLESAREFGTAAERADEPEKSERRRKFMSRPPIPAAERGIRELQRLIYKTSTDPKSVINSIAEAKGVSPEEVMRVALANDPMHVNTPEAKAARLEVGDQISDDFRKGKPWIVEQAKGGRLQLRSGQASPLPLDRLNPSDRVRQLVERGTVTSQKPEFSPEDISKAAFESPHYVQHQEELAERVKDRMEGKEKTPEPRIPVEAAAQAQNAERRSDASESVAARAVVESIDPKGISEEEAQHKVTKAEEKIKVAEEAYAQAVEAKSKTEPQDGFPQKAPVSIGLRGVSSTIVQNNREVPFHYELLPIDAPITSHEWRGSQMVPREEFPSALQPRTISESESLQNALRADRANYDNRQWTDKTISGAMGHSILDPGGYTVGGNTRLEIRRRHLENLRAISDPEERQAALDGFTASVRKDAQSVKIRRRHLENLRAISDPEEDAQSVEFPDDGKTYDVFRVLDNPIETMREAADLGRLFNKSVSVQITKAARGVSFAKSLSEDVMVEVGRLVDANDGIAAAIQANPEYFSNLVITRFDLDPTEYADWFMDVDGKGKVLHEEGRNQLSKALMGKVFKDNSILSRLQGKTPYRAAERSLAYLIKMQAMPDRNIVGKIQEAMQAAADTSTTDLALSASRDPWKATYHPDQQSLVGMEVELPPEPDRMTEVLWRALHASDAATPRIFNDRLKAFLGEESTAGGWIFEEHVETPAEAFNRAFSREIKLTAFSRGDKNEEITQDEFDAALRNRQMSDQERREALEKSKPQAKEVLSEKESEPEQGKKAEIVKKLTAPPKPPSKAELAVDDLARAKAQKGYVTPQKFKEFLEKHPDTKDHASEYYRIAKLTSEYVYDLDPPVGVERKDALDWVLRERLAGIEEGKLTTKRGEYSDPLIEKGFGTGIMKMHKASNASTWIHEWAHVLFPLLSDEDLKAIDTIKGPKARSGEAELPTWDGHRGSLKGKVYVGLSEKLAHGLEQFLRDENPTGFTHEVKALLAKVKDIMRKVYLAMSRDPLSDYKNTEESRLVFSKMFGITDFDVQTDWRDEVKKARAEEKRLKKPSEEKHPLQKIAADLGAKGLKKTFEGHVEDSVGDRIDPKKPTAVLVFKNMEDAVAAFAPMGTEASKIESAELIQAPDGQWGIRINTKTQPPPDILNQDVPPRHPALRLEELQKRLAATPTFKAMERKLIQLQIDNLKKLIREKYEAESPEPEPQPELAKQVLQEVKNGKDSERLRKGTNAVPGLQRPSIPRGIPKPPVMGMPGHAGTGGKRGGTLRDVVAGAVPASLSDVKPVSLEPLRTDRGAAVGPTVGTPFDQSRWVTSLKDDGLSESLLAPTWALDRTTAAMLKFPGQKQSAQSTLSALEQGDGAVVANATGSGKTHVICAIAKEWMARHQEARVLQITKNTTLLKEAKELAANSYGYELETKIPDKNAAAGAYGTTYQRILANKSILNTKWDLVIADESGEMRNWFREENKQGKAAMAVIENSRKAVYVSATPFHSPNEYGYLEKLGLWKKGEFSKWIESNFAHEKIDGKVIAKLDPAKQAKLRQQLIERGQLTSQSISYEGYTAHFGVVPVTDEIKRKLDRIREGFQRAKGQLIQMGKKGLAEKAAAFEATYTKSFLERERIPQAIELIKKAREQGWQALVFSETSSEDLFRRDRDPGEEPSTYQQLDDAMGGQLSKIIPPFEDVYQALKEEFGDNIADYSGRGNTMAERDKAKSDFLAGKTPILYTTYAAGGIGVSLHDADYPSLGITGGDKPRVAIHLGPPYSGVLLEQAMGRPWRFGVKSDVHAVFLATDSEPDIRLMQTKVGPRMKALRAAVLGERDSLASVMATYNDEEKVRARQDALAFAEGDESKVSAASFTVRSKSRNVGINDWSAINFPSAETAKNKGMKYGEDVPGGDWSTLYQARFGFPDSEEQSRANKEIDKVAASAANNPNLPREAIAFSAAKASDVAGDAPEGIDKSAAGRQVVEGEINSYGFFQDPETGEWKGPHEIIKTIMGKDVKGINEKSVRYTIPTLGMNFEQRLIAAGRKIKAEESVREPIRQVRDYYQAKQGYQGQLRNDLLDIFNRNKLDPHDEKTMQDIFDVVQGQRTTANPDIEKAASEVSDFMVQGRRLMADKNVQFETGDGRTLSYKVIPDNPRYMPHLTDWDMELTDSVTGEKKTLRQITDDETLDDVAKLKYFEAERQRLNATPENARQWLDEVKRDRRRMYESKNANVTERRELNHPFYHRNIWALDRYIDQVSDEIAKQENFGYDMGKLRQSVAKIPSQKLRKDILNSVATIFEPQDWDTWMGKVVRHGQGIEALTKMTLSPVSAMFHGIHATMGLGGKVSPVLKSAGRWMTHPKEFMREKYYMGVVNTRMNPWLLEGGRVGGLTGHFFELSGFNGIYKWTRAIVGESANVWMTENALNDLRKGGNKADEARRILKDRMLIGDLAIDKAIANNKWSPDDLDKGQRAFADYVAFSENPLQMPKLSRMSMAQDLTDAEKNLHAAVRGMYMLQSFSIKTYSLLRESLFDEVFIHHNYKPLLPFIFLYPAAGFVLFGLKSGAKAGMQGLIEKARGLPHRHDALDTIMDEFRDVEKHPWAGFLKLYVDSLCTATGMESTRRWTDLAMMMAMDESGKADNMLKYILMDEMEQKVGGLYSDALKLLYTQTEAAYDYRHTKHPEKKLPAAVRDEARELEEFVQITRAIPQVEKLAHPPKKTEVKRYY